MEFLNIFATLLGLLATSIALYVNYRIATFENRLVDKINGLYVRTKRFEDWEHAHDAVHVVMMKELNRLRDWKQDDMVPLIQRLIKLSERE